MLASLAEQEPELLELISKSVAGGHLRCAVRREIRYGAVEERLLHPDARVSIAVAGVVFGGGVWDVCQLAPILSKKPSPWRFFASATPRFDIGLVVCGYPRIPKAPRIRQLGSCFAFFPISTLEFSFFLNKPHPRSFVKK